MRPLEEAGLFRTTYAFVEEGGGRRRRGQRWRGCAGAVEEHMMPEMGFVRWSVVPGIRVTDLALPDTQPPLVSRTACAFMDGQDVGKDMLAPCVYQSRTSKVDPIGKCDKPTS